MKSFIVDKWYKAEGYFIKFKRIERIIDYNRIHGETIDPTCKYKEIDRWANTDLENEALSRGPLEDLDEIQEYLPDGHIDKYTTIKVEDDYSYLMKLLEKLNII